MEKAKTDRRTKYTCMALKKSLMELMERKPISKITIKEICENADINRSTFYTHYKDQYDLLQSIEDEIIDELNARLKECDYHRDMDKLYVTLERIFQFIADNSGFCRLLLSEGGDPAFQKRLMVLVQRRYMVRTADGQALDEETAECLYCFMVNGSIGVVQHWLKGGLRKTPREMARLLMDMTGRGMAAFQGGT